MMGAMDNPGKKERPDGPVNYESDVWAGGDEGTQTVPMFPVAAGKKVRTEMIRPMTMEDFEEVHALMDGHSRIWYPQHRRCQRRVWAFFAEEILTPAWWRW